jgi:hypothetical protein
MTQQTAKKLARDGSWKIIDECEDIHDNIAQPAAVIFLHACHPGPNGHDHEREQRMIAWQHAACERSAKELGAHIIREYMGGTGNIDTRVVIRRMLNELHTQRDITYLIVTKKDRLARRIHDWATLSQEIHAAGVNLSPLTIHLLPDS